MHDAFSPGSADASPAKQVSYSREAAKSILQMAKMPANFAKEITTRLSAISLIYKLSMKSSLLAALFPSRGWRRHECQY